ncbi:hypothetical protein FC19_GL002036 [Liquorilactobacillus aquaticus DSM 21051]|uniref:Uracil-DNA glycosylase-like domain-containing protein n=1 Tax=Liquorilactobacillus aquaticus DSM 21051 TaxID=1423725 RepID=A0A0R2CVR4_9LACO|nr:DUF1643 domain-containing protein [Liquorilactobacillus aquaticus]KRM95418.1 hypothetical protein FC19_GL002036 [Liquorilactobacillus aquaticus DSM 21051]
MAENETRKHLEKATVTIERKVKGKDIYWTKYLWDKEKPLVLIISNYPSSKSLLQEDLTTILIKNEIIEMKKFGGVIIANLFTRPMQTINERTLGEAFPVDGMDELIKIVGEVEKVIIAIGSLATRYQVATDRMKLFVNQVQKAGIVVEKFYDLINGQHKTVHPLAIRNEHWRLVQWNKECQKELMLDE